MIPQILRNQFTFEMAAPDGRAIAPCEAVVVVAGVEEATVVVVAVVAGCEEAGVLVTGVMLLDTTGPCGLLGGSWNKEA